MKLVFASDSFKESLSTYKICEILTKNAKAVFPICQTLCFPMADGGEGTIDVLIEALNGKKIYLQVNDPLFNKITTYYGAFNDTAIIEMAAASGLSLVPCDKRNPLLTSTYGTGELIMDAIQNGYKNIIITVGGSATNDGGIGAMTALGVKFIDKNGKTLIGTGKDLAEIKDIDLSCFEDKFKNISFTILSDVKNILLGENGATKTFARQKGASEKDILFLENGMTNFCNIVNKKLSIDPNSIVGGGAAGGLSACLSAFLNAKIQSGIESIIEILNFKEKVKDADIIITGEGKIDGQSASGKVVSGVAKVGKELGIPVVALVGSIGEDVEKIYDLGVSSIFTILDSPMSLNFAIKNAEKLYSDASMRMFKFLRLGMEINKN